MGCVVVVTSQNVFIVDIDEAHFSFDDMIGAEDNEVYCSKNGTMEMHITKQHSFYTENRRAL